MSPTRECTIIVAEVYDTRGSHMHVFLLSHGELGTWESEYRQVGFRHFVTA